MQKFYSLIVLLVSIQLSFQLTAQTNTFDGVISILNENGCNNGYCHGNINFDLTGNSSQIYDAMVGAIPSNELSALKGDKIVEPGYPERSLLYRKINHDLHLDSKLEEGEGVPMPYEGAEISDRDKEYIRQWIYFGAPETGKAFSDDVKEAFEVYHEEGGLPMTEIPEPPAVGEGFQVHLGPVFLKPGFEVEYLKKYALRLEDNVEVNRIENFMTDFSHHFIIYKFSNPGEASLRSEGLRNLAILGIDSPFGAGTDFVTLWQDEKDFRLPEGTAYKWDNNDVLDLNFHVKNYSTSQVLAADVYFNVYTQANGTAEKEMFSELIINPAIGTPNDGEEYWFSHTFTGSNTGPGGGNVWNGNANIWMLTSHTHKYGKDYDIYLGTADNLGVQLFEGQYDTEYTQYIGTYDYEHPPVRYFDAFLEVESNIQMTQKAMFINDGDAPVAFGLTTDDEMMLAAIQYTLGTNHQEDMIVEEGIPTAVCEGHDPIKLIDNYERGPVGSGVIDNWFYPAVAGVGVHEIIINCCNPGDQTVFTIEVKEFVFDAPEISVSGTEQSPVLNFVLNDPDLQSNDYQINWYLDGALIVGENTTVILAQEPGIYSTEIASPNGCSLRSADVSIEIAIDSGLDDLNAYALNLSPNPFSDQTNLSYRLNEISKVKIELFDLSGKLIRSVFEGAQSVGEYNVKIGAIETAGVYLLKTTIADKHFTQKLVRQ